MYDFKYIRIVVPGLIKLKNPPKVASQDVPNLESILTGVLFCIVQFK